LERLKLNASIRTQTGNGPARSLRRSGRFPAVVYGPKTEPILLTINQSEFEQVIKKRNINQILFNLLLDGGNRQAKTVMVKELQTDPVSRDLLHADFYEIDMGRKIRVNIPVVTTGKAKGVEMGGVLQVVRRELEVLCLPGEIPETIEVDITEMNIGDSLHVEDIPLEGNIEIPTDVNFTVITLLSPTVEELEEEEEEAEALEVEGEEEAPDTGGEE
jgi:large subunit ribosomal protein L25